tara:strand:- start:287 stop:670 length:384 start_codon:yes stop_codon:yes gene_type:complete
LNVVDTSGWLEFVADGPNARFFEEPLKQGHRLVVPSVVALEVFRKINREQGMSPAMEMAGQMRQAGTFVDLDYQVAVEAGRLGIEYKLPLADSIIYATAQIFRATLWTQDADFKGLDGVKFRAKKKR